MGFVLRLRQLAVSMKFFLACIPGQPLLEMMKSHLLIFIFLKKEDYWQRVQKC